MSEELIAEAEETKPKRKAPAKKAAAKKASVKKPAAKTARKATKKKAADAAEVEAPKLFVAETPAPVATEPVVVEAPAPAPVAEVVAPATPAPAENNDADDAESPADAAGGSSGEGDVPRNMIMGENGQLRPMTSKERRKAKFERWKQRRAERRGGGGGDRERQGQNGAEPYSGGGQERETEPEKPLGPPEPANGILEMSPKGYGFLRQRDRSFAQHPQDAFIAPEFIRKYGLREGMHINGVQCKGHRGPQITEVNEVNGRAPEAMRDLPLFEELKAVNPNKRYQLETGKDRLTTRVIDMMTPVGRGQRGLIVAPPRAGKTTMLQHIAEAVVENHPGVHLMILLVDERPEEVTDFKRHFADIPEGVGRCRVIASSNDHDAEKHIAISILTMDRCKRMVEAGKHVVVMMDSLTRLGRAFNRSKRYAGSGRTMSGGIDSKALEVPKQIFGAARNTEEAGSLTMIASCLVDTGSQGDQLIFEEFKGTGNMELILDRKISEKRLFPSINLAASGTRKENLLMEEQELKTITALRRRLLAMPPHSQIEQLLAALQRFPTNSALVGSAG